MLAVKNRHTGAFDLLLKAISDADQRNRQECEANAQGFHSGAVMSHISMINAKDQHGQTALMYAALQDNAAMIGALFNCGAKLNEKNKEGKTAVELAVENKQHAAIDALRQCGAHIDKPVSRTRLKSTQSSNYGSL